MLKSTVNDIGTEDIIDCARFWFIMFIYILQPKGPVVPVILEADGFVILGFYEEEECNFTPLSPHTPVIAFLRLFRLTTKLCIIPVANPSFLINSNMENFHMRIHPHENSCHLDKITSWVNKQKIGPRLKTWLVQIWKLYQHLARRCSAVTSHCSSNPKLRACTTASKTF